MQELLIDVPTALYLDLGETKSTRFTLDATIASRSWIGSIGLYWGGKPVPTADPNEGDQPQLHKVIFTAHEWEGKHNAYLERERVIHRPKQNNTTTHSSGVSGTKIEWPVPLSNHLELRIRDDNVRVSWNGQLKEEMLRAAPLPEIPNLSAAGRFGIFADGGTFQVSDVRIRLER